MAALNAIVFAAPVVSRQLNFAFRRCTVNTNYILKVLQRRSLITSSQRSCSPASNQEPLPAPSPDGAPIEYSEKIVNIVDEISKLTLLEVVNLNTLLKEKLKIPDAPMMPAGGMMAMAPAPPKEDAEPEKEEQTEFAIKLVKFEEGSKIKLIKEIKNILPEMNLVQAKKFVEGSPNLVKEKVPKEEAEKIKKQLETVGGVVELE